MKKQIQFGTFKLYGTAADKEVRAQLEEPLNHGWSVNDWKVIGVGKDEQNSTVVDIVVCLTRELQDDGPSPESTEEVEVVAKRGRPAKVDA